jgi:hypothetical protein
LLFFQLLIESMIFAFQHENILLIDNNYMYDEIHMSLDNHHLLYRQIQFSKNRKISECKIEQYHHIRNMSQTFVTWFVHP